MEQPLSDLSGTGDADDARSRIVAAASALVEEGGRDALTTRAVSAAASVQAPTIYRLFGDKRGLEDAVAEHGLRKYMAEKLAREAHADPVQDLRESWNVHMAFGLEHPDLFALMNSEPGQTSPAVAAGLEVLRRRIKRIALAGRLKVSEERAVSLVQAVGNGTIQTLLAQPVEKRDFGLADTAREAVIAAVSTEATADHGGAAVAAVALRAALPDLAPLSANERGLMGEWLDRIVARSQ